MLAVFRSLKHIYAQVIDDDNGHTLAAASSNEKNGSKRRTAAMWPAPRKSESSLAERAKEKGITEGGLRPRRISVSRPREGSGRRGARGRTGVLKGCLLSRSRRIDASEPQSQRAGGLDQPRDQGRQGR